MSNMQKRDARGEINVLLIPLILVVLLLFGALGFGYWAFQSRQDYKYHSDQKSAAAVQVANRQLTASLNEQFSQKEKSPLTTYNGPQASGSLSIQYPKTWSSYVIENAQSDPSINGYFYPGTVPDTTNISNAFALRVEVTSETYSQVIQGYQGQVTAGQVTVKPYSLPRLPNVVGVYISGQIQAQKQGALVVLPLRSQTLEIWTESNRFTQDFNNIVLKNFTFSP